MAARFLAVDLAYSLSDRDSRAFLGRYRSPVAFLPWVEFLPDLVPHSSFVQLSKDFCDSFLAITELAIYHADIHVEHVVECCLEFGSTLRVLLVSQ